ncbi:hypothetical protein F7725_023725 [Dissostichus mawsoni]|uniref:Sulfotransferase n=1 Tax=Dissostichus mawsoni TaxID=36200 RepID=A0A7J5XXC5_DISMA|nr:hypothetical protein F7725_023725 [Dissostichus mawsoni]
MTSTDTMSGLSSGPTFRSVTPEGTTSGFGPNFLGKSPRHYGFNWMVGVVRKIMAEEATGVKTEARMPPLMEFFGPEMRWRRLPLGGFWGLTFIPTTSPPPSMKKTKILVIFRNPKDTLVSFYHFSNNNPVLPSESWDSFYSNFMSGDDGSTFSAMKQSSANSHGALGDVIFRKGEVGDWKNHFTPNRAERWTPPSTKLAGTRLGAKLNYQRHCQ